MSKSTDRDISYLQDQFDGDVASLLIKMQRQLHFLEKKIDRLALQLQEKQYREDSSMDKPYTPRPYSKSSSISARVRNQRKEKHREKAEERGPDKAFYSKFRVTNRHPGSDSRKKPFHHKKKKK
jgi:hypothetical protein